MQHGIRLRLDDRLLVLPLDVVVRVVRAVHVTPLAHAPGPVAGVIDVQGEMVAVIDMRRRFGLAARPLELSDHFVIARIPRRTLALWVDGVDRVVEWSDEDFADAGPVLPGTRYLAGVAPSEDGPLLVHDLERLLSTDEASALDAAMHDE